MFEVLVAKCNKTQDGFKKIADRVRFPLEPTSWQIRAGASSPRHTSFPTFNHRQEKIHLESILKLPFLCQFKFNFAPDTTRLACKVLYKLAPVPFLWLPSWPHWIRAMTTASGAAIKVATGGKENVLKPQVCHRLSYCVTSVSLLIKWSHSEYLSSTVSGG